MKTGLISQTFGPATIDANEEFLLANDVKGLTLVTFQTVGTFSGTLQAQVSVDGTNFEQVDVIPVDSQTPATNVTTENIFFVPISGAVKFRVIATAWTSGSVVVTAQGSYGSAAGGSSGGGGGGDASAENQDEQTALLTTIDTDTGNIATSTSGAATSLAIIDDWDESDRAKVNLIVGQAGIAAGAGAVGATVPRITIASDDPLLARNLPRSRSDTYTTTASGTTVDCTLNAVKFFTVQVKGTDAAATSWVVEVEISLDNVNFDTIFTHNSTSNGDGSLASFPTPTPALYFRTRCSAIVLGSATNIVVTVVGMP